MRIYQAGVANYGLSYPILMDMLERKEVYTLESFWYASRLIKAFEKYPNFKIFLDSGAYSWDHQMTMQGKTVTEKDENEYLNRYIEFIKKYEDRLYIYANLDFVGDPEKTQRMQERMEEAGLHPTPVFHYTSKQGKYGGVQDEHFNHLKRIVDKYDYLCLGGGVSGGLFSYKYMTLFGKKAWGIIKSAGRPIKVHGFGLTSVPVMLRYGWYSVDSTNWIKSAAFGIVYMPRFHPKTHQPLYDEIPRRFAVSAVAKHKDTVASHFENEFADEASHEEIKNYFDSIGIDMQKMEDTSIERVLANFRYFNNFLKYREEHHPNGIVNKKSTNKFF